MPSVTETLRRAVERSGETRYAISKATGISEATLSRFVVRGNALSGETIDTLSAYLGLELVRKREPLKTRDRKGR